MAIVDEAALIAFVKETMGASYSKVSDEGFSTAVTQASQELKWSLPLDDGFKRVLDRVERTKRYVIQILLVEAALNSNTNRFIFNIDLIITSNSYR